MKKQFLFFAVAALALASCSSENDVVQTPNVVEQAIDDGAVGFDAYLNRGVTRAGAVGTLTTNSPGTVQLTTEGFGVFGYYTNSSTYDQQAQPNFFYNQKVAFEDGYWKYEPVKYWPNEFGTSAESEDQDKVSFFAYAPYVLVNPSTGKAVNALEPNVFNQEESAGMQKWGISSLSRNSATGDPLVKYIASFDQDKCVDLCWGVCDQPSWLRVFDGSVQSINGGKTGLPWIDVERPAEAKTQAEAQQRVKFTFKHATSQLIVKIDAFVDGIDNTNAINNSETRVYVRSINFEGFAMKGALNLNNTESGQNKAYWLDFAGTNDLVTGESVTIYDGRKDGKEGTPSGVATNEKSLGLNPALIQSDTWANHTTDGVTNVEQYLFRKQTASSPEITYGAADGPIYVIPTGDEIKVTIVYDIETADNNLATYVSDATQHGSSIENCITKTISFGGNETLENGKAYTLKLHLGLNSVKFDADVTDWVDATGGEADLPANVPMFAAEASGAGAKAVTVPAATTSYMFGVNKLTANESATATPGSTGIVKDATIANEKANSAGIAIVTATMDENMTAFSKDGTVAVIGNSSGYGTTLTITQQPHVLGLAAKGAVGKVITISSTATGTDFSASGITNTVEVKKNGTTLTVGTAAPGDATECQFEASSTAGEIGTLTFFDNLTLGDVYEISVTSSDGETSTTDADKETISYKLTGDMMRTSTYNLNVAADATSAVVQVAGMTVGTTPINITPDGSVVTAASLRTTTIPESTVGTFDLTINKNLSTTKKTTTNALKFKDREDSEWTRITLIQAAHPLGINSVSYDTDKFTFTLKTTLDDVEKMIEIDNVKVYKDGTELTTGVTISDTDLTITISDTTAGKYTFVFKDGDAAEETISYTVVTP